VCVCVRACAHVCVCSTRHNIKCRAAFKIKCKSLIKSLTHKPGSFLSVYACCTVLTRSQSSRTTAPSMLCTFRLSFDVQFFWTASVRCSMDVGYKVYSMHYCCSPLPASPTHAKAAALPRPDLCISPPRRHCHRHYPSASSLPAATIPLSRHFLPPLQRLSLPFALDGFSAAGTLRVEMAPLVHRLPGFSKGFASSPYVRVWLCLLCSTTGGLA
jgi:hypothetical protein